MTHAHAHNLSTASPYSLIGMDMQGLTIMLDEFGQPSFRAKQLFHWIYHRGAQDFAVMGNIGKDLRARLQERTNLDRPKISAHQQSQDGTQKWLLEFHDGN
ncbi:MAG: bifunctional tRNA (adenosine(37)-C2)-methyltransferase TrmG/ribosomal RNA large subunit methyltransferase RlmN, partial [Pseudomonadota bacterium]